MLLKTPAPSIKKNVDPYRILLKNKNQKKQEKEHRFLMLPHLSFILFSRLLPIVLLGLLALYLQLLH
jgi:hypothetical protein